MTCWQYSNIFDQGHRVKTLEFGLSNSHLGLGALLAKSPYYFQIQQSTFFYTCFLATGPSLVQQDRRIIILWCKQRIRIHLQSLLCRLGSTFHMRLAPCWPAQFLWPGSWTRARLYSAIINYIYSCSFYTCTFVIFFI
jgi:hypothetical protein